MNTNSHVFRIKHWLYIILGVVCAAAVTIAPNFLYWESKQTRLISEKAFTEIPPSDVHIVNGIPIGGVITPDSLVLLLGAITNSGISDPISLISVLSAPDMIALVYTTTDNRKPVQFTFTNANWIYLRRVELDH